MLELPRRRMLTGLCAMSAGCLFLHKARAQEVRGRRSEAERERLNSNRIGLITGGPGGNYMRLGADIARLLDDHANLEMRVIVMFGKGSLQNIDDLYNLYQVDAAIVQFDVLKFIQQTIAQLPAEERVARGLNRISEQVSYITRLYNEELHLLGRKDARELRDLAGKAVNLGEVNSGTYLTASQVVDLDGVELDRRAYNDDIALEKLKLGEIAAMFFVAGKPAPLFARIGHEEAAEFGLHFLTVPRFGDYVPARLTHTDYSGLVPEGSEVATIAGPAVLAVYNWPRGNPRYRPLAKFSRLLLERIGELPERYPSFAKYGEIDPRADVPGWTRFDAAAEWLSAGPVGGAVSCDQAAERSFRGEGRDPHAIPWGEVQERQRRLRAQGRC